MPVRSCGSSFRIGCRDFDERPGLVRALAFSQLGQSVRAFRRWERLGAIGQTLRQELGELPEEELRRAEAVLAYLHMLAYTTLARGERPFGRRDR